MAAAPAPLFQVLNQGEFKPSKKRSRDIRAATLRDILYGNYSIIVAKAINSKLVYYKFLMLVDDQSITCVCNSKLCNTFTSFGSGSATIIKNIMTSSLQCYNGAGPTSNLTIVHGASYCVSGITTNTTGAHQLVCGMSMGLYLTDPNALDYQLGCTTLSGFYRDIQHTDCLCKTNLCNTLTLPPPSSKAPSTQISVMGRIG